MPREELTTVLKQAAADLGAKLQKSAANPLQDVWGKIDEPNRQAVRNALIGALIGGAGGAVYGGSAADPEAKVRGALQSLLTGAALGGTAAGAGTVGINMLTGKTKLPGEEAASGLISSPVDWAGSTVVGHPLAVGGGVGGTLLAARKGPTYGNLLRLVNESKLKELTKLQKPVAELAKQPRIDPVAVGAAGRSLKELAGVPGNVLGAGRAAVPKQVAERLAELEEQLQKGKLAVPPLAAEQLAPLKKQLRTAKLAKLKAQLQAALKAGPKELMKVIRRATGRAAVISSGVSAGSRASQAARLIGPAHVPSKLWWAAAPLGLGTGYLVDKYLKGDY
jgi:hypothetical protein